jgi:hypothetical protein
LGHVQAFNWEIDIFGNLSGALISQVAKSFEMYYQKSREHLYRHLLRGGHMVFALAAEPFIASAEKLFLREGLQAIVNCRLILDFRALIA